MPKLPLTVKEKEDKKLRNQLLLAHNQVLSAWNFGEIKTWEGVYSKLGYGIEYINQHPELKKGVTTYQEVKEFLLRQKEQLEKDILINHARYNQAVEDYTKREGDSRPV